MSTSGGVQTETGELTLVFGLNTLFMINQNAFPIYYDGVVWNGVKVPLSGWLEPKECRTLTVQFLRRYVRSETSDSDQQAAGTT